MNERDRLDLIARAYDTDLLHRCGASLFDLLCDHFRSIHEETEPVQRWRPPDENTQQADALMERSPASSLVGQELDDEGVDPSQAIDQISQRFSELVSTSLRHGQNLHHRHCAGHQVPASIPMAALFDTVTTLTNQVQGVYEMGPWCVSVERAVLAKVGEAIGFQAGRFGALITSGGSLANLTALLAARHERCRGFWKTGGHDSDQAPVIVVNEEAHYCVERAAGVMGVGTDHIIRIPTDRQKRMRIDALERVLDDLSRRSVPVIAVVAVACTTPTGAFDPIKDVSAICRRYKVWLHVDAAHGGAVVFSQRHQHLVEGLHLADSVVVDAHKMMFLPAVCAMLFYRQKQHRLVAFDQTAPYLFDPSAPEMAEYDNAVTTFECTKRATALGLWGVWSLFGPDIFEAMIDQTIEVAERFYQKILADESFEAFLPPSCNIVVYRYLPETLRDLAPEKIDLLQLQLRRHLLETGTAYITQTRIDGRIYLRSTIMNPLIDDPALDRILHALREGGRHLVDRIKTEPLSA